jgi:hypothetical protein
VTVREKGVPTEDAAEVRLNFGCGPTATQLASELMYSFCTV